MPARKPTVKKPYVKPDPKTAHTVEPEELWDDDTEILRFTIPLQPITKKTSQRIVFRRILPSKQYCAYEEDCAKYCLAAWVGKEHTPDEWEEAILLKHKTIGKAPDDVWTSFPEWFTRDPIDYGVSISMQVYLKSYVIGDETGYLQSLFDILQKWGVVLNDSWFNVDKQGIHFLGGIDKDNPRTEIVIRRRRHPKEAYRAKQEADEVLRKARAENRVQARKSVGVIK